MSERKYEDMIHTLEPTGIVHPMYGHEIREPLMYNGVASIPGSPDVQISCQLMLQSGAGWGLGHVIESPGGQITDFPHSHDGDEIWLFLGTNPDDNKDLGGNIEFWFGEGDEAEKHLITKPTALLVPAGVVHCPVVFKDVKRPIVSLPILFSPSYKSNYVGMPPAFEREE
jgi:hypothetical protein